MTFWRFGAWLAFVALVSLGWGQDPFDVHVAQMELLQMRPVQRDMGVTEMQRAQLNKHADWFNDEMKKLQAKYEGNESASTEAMQAVSDLHGRMKLRVLGELTANQVRRLREISLQDAGPLSLMDQQVATRINLSSENLEKLRAKFQESGQAASKLEEETLGPIFEKYREKAMAGDTAAQTALENEVNAARQRIAPEMNRMQAGFLQTVESSLTDENKARFMQLQGLPFYT